MGLMRSAWDTGGLFRRLLRMPSSSTTMEPAAIAYAAICADSAPLLQM